MSTIDAGDFEWDDLKEQQNIARHGVSFEEAATVFVDLNAVYLDDGAGIGRLAVIGMSVRARVLLVVHVVRGSKDRIISARKVNRAEANLYGRRD